jgi:fructosamine-3-kinase
MSVSAVARAEAAAVLGVAASAVRVRPVGGGCISPAARVDAAGRSVFVKSTGSSTPSDLFAAEAEGLALLRRARAVRVPEVLAVSADALVLEWLEPGAPTAPAWRTLGTQLAALHRLTADGCGLARDNYIGPLRQANGWLKDWPAFFRERRVVPQLERALHDGAFDARARVELHAFVDALPALLADVADDPPSLLHGDLWSGNALALAGGDIALVDPACYFGHREVDLAMAELFGGFPAAFFDAYEESWPTRTAGRTQRRSAYRVYYLLVHVNLFGSGYVARTLQAVRTALA